MLCSAAHLPPPDAWYARAALVRAEGTAAVAEAVAARWFTEAFRRDHPEVVDRHVDGLRATDAEGYAACCEAIGDMDLREDLGRIVAPTLVIAGRDDPATTVTDASVIAELISGARLTVVDAAHLANVERADLVTGVMTEHLLMTEHFAITDRPTSREVDVAAAGARTRREVLGDDHVDGPQPPRTPSPPTSRTSSPATRGARSGPGPGSTRGTRSCITLAMLAVLRQEA